MKEIKVKGINGDVHFYDPYILNKDILAFRGTSIEGLQVSQGNIILNEKEGGIEIRHKNKRYLVKLNNEDVKALIDYRKKEAKEANEFFRRLASDKEIIRVYIDEIPLIKSETSLNIGFTPYYDKILRFILEKQTNGLIKDSVEGEFQEQLGKLLNEKVDLSKFKIIKESDGSYIKTTVTTICKYITA